jgi:large subunit ribosomal protein L15
MNLKNINENFKEGDVINPEALVEKGFIKKATVPVKILGEGELQLKDLKFEGVAVSTGAREQIEKMKGAIK